MPALQFGVSAFERGRGAMPQIPLINLVAEKSETEPSGIILQSRMAIGDAGISMGGGPVTAIMQMNGVFGGDVFGVSDGGLYRAATRLGTIDGAGSASIIANEAGVVCAAGARCWAYDGNAFAPVDFPDGANVAKVIEAGGRFVALRAGTGKFYWTLPLGMTFDALDFATAENEPDELLDALHIDDVLVLFGASTIEYWPNTGDAELPFQPLEGRVIERGIRATGCATVFDAGYAHVSQHNVVYLNGETAISNPGLEEKVAASATCRLFTCQMEGQELLVLRLDDASYVYGNRNRLWSQFTSFRRSNWICGAASGQWLGSSVDGRVLRFTHGFADDGGTFERRFRATAPLMGGATPIDNVRLRTMPGLALELEGEFANPLIEMRSSRNGGRTFGTWQQEKLGRQGEYAPRVEWRAQGVASDPGIVLEFRVTAPVPFAVAGVSVNEDYGGR